MEHSGKPRIIDSDLDAADGRKKNGSLQKKQLVHKLNYFNFINQTVRICFRHYKDQRLISLEALPQLCFGRRLLCLWQQPHDVNQIKEQYQLEEMVLAEGRDIVHVTASLRGISEKGVCLTLPETSTRTTARKARRYSCETLKATLIQNGIVFSGFLLDFSAISFRVAIEPSPSQTRQWLNLKDKANLIITKDEETIYSSECSILQRDLHEDDRQLVLKPLTVNIQRFSPKTFRSHRLHLSPTPDAIFDHPFTERLVTLKTIDISGSGLSVEDDETTSLLLPGLIIPELTVKLANTFQITCRAQVLYRRPIGEEENGSAVQCGIAFLDMDCHEHMRLLSLLHQAENRHLYICSRVDMDELWRFFFAAGFMYPQKYKFIQENKDSIRQTYENLYTTNSSVSRYFTWQSKGSIQGHLAMLRFYERTWMIHHLAALPSSRKRIGIEVLNQIGAFTYDSHRLNSSNMDYLICYFRPENRFSNYFFDGIQKSIGNHRGCSIYAFAYLHYRNNRGTDTDLDSGWQFLRSTYADLLELQNSYGQRGELMLKALDLMPDKEMEERHDLSDEFRKFDLKRQRRLYSLKRDGIIKAVFMANISDFAMNLSDLTNSITIFIIDPEYLAPANLYTPILRIAEKYRQKRFPLLIFPLSFVKEQKMKYERTYNLWVISMEYTDDYFQHFTRLL